MENKLQSLHSFQSKFEENMQIFKNTVTEATRKFVFACVNIDKMPEYLYKVVEPYISMTKPQHEDILQEGSLGEYLRNAKKDTTNSNSVLFLDFYGELRTLYSTNAELVDSLNTNRDLFMSVFRSVIIVLSNNQIYAVMKHAYDLWSCKGLYVDTTHWFSSLAGYPLVKIRVSSLEENRLLDILLSNTVVLKKFSEIGERIRNLTKIDKSMITDLKNDILSFSNAVCYHVLLLKFVEKVLSLKISSKDVWVLSLIRKMAAQNDVVEILDVYIMLGEFYYKYNDCITAAYYYNYVQQTLLTIEPPEKYILTLLACNELICFESYERQLTVESLESKLKNILVESKTDTTSYNMFIEAYLQLVRCSSEVDSYAKHRDNYINLQQFYPMRIPYADLTEEYVKRMNWECYLFSGNETPIASNFINYMYEQIVSSFCRGDYNTAFSGYHKLKNHLMRCNEYSYLNVLKAVYHNMKYLQIL